MRLFILWLAFTTVFKEIGSFVNMYVFDDWSFIPFLVVAISIDTLTGVYANAKLGRLHSFKMRSLFEKVQMYAVGLIIIHGISSHLVDGSPNPIVQTLVPFLKGAFYVYMLFCEGLSIEENLQKIGKSYLPKWIKSKMLDYQETGKLPSEAEPIINE